MNSGIHVRTYLGENPVTKEDVYGVHVIKDINGGETEIVRIVCVDRIDQTRVTNELINLINMLR